MFIRAFAKESVFRGEAVKGNKNRKMPEDEEKLPKPTKGQKKTEKVQKDK